MHRINSPFQVFLFSALILLLGGCNGKLPSWKNGKLLVVVSESDQGAEAEFEREMTTLFAKDLHSEIEFIPSSPDRVDRTLRKHQAHLAAASLRSQVNVASLYFGPSYRTVKEQLICNQETGTPKKIDDLLNLRLGVLSGSAQEFALKELLPKYPGLKWQSRSNADAQALITEVSEGALDCTVANENSYASARNHYTNINASLTIGAPSKLAWAFSMDADPQFIAAVKSFFSRIKRDGTLNRLIDRYYGHNGRLHRLDAAAFISNAGTVLPEYRNLFEEAATLTGLDWRLLAALAYQESQWNPLATSFTNVRGMMMLTEDTADRMQVTDRLDPRESVLAGARYLALLRDQLPAKIKDPDRTWMALAAYNQGVGHLEDARVLTARMGMNPNSWADIKKWMPMLNQPGYYETLKYGYARGGEAVILVENIRNYHDMLKRLEPDHASASASFSYKLVEPLKRLLR
ncbi:MAG: membrane-bound lytic murein transglycosylase MltF [Gallionella sp.]|jgi:membrane-bound lytic murein transglycosylase F|nr:membrane-bound lytic murein transglycosylase MltF [Gallionella sp.]